VLLVFLISWSPPLRIEAQFLTVLLLLIISQTVPCPGLCEGVTFQASQHESFEVMIFGTDSLASSARNDIALFDFCDPDISSTLLLF